MNFANPAAAWALLAVPAVLAIHLLQRRPREQTVSTLFLWEAAAARSLGGRRLDRLRRSASLWLQLLAAGLLAFLLMGPRRLSEDSVQKVAVVLDSTASMSAFRARAEAALVRRARALEGRAGRTEWVLLESTLRQPALYAGSDTGALLGALTSWDPRLPGHDLAPALDTARGLVGDSGLVVLLTDHAASVPVGVERLAVGQPIDNVGFAGARVEGAATWRAVVQNHGREPASRRWGIAEAGGRKVLGELSLGPGEMRSLSGPFPPGRDTVELVLDPDAFPLDDRLPLLKPRPKELRVAVDASAATLPFVPRFLSTLDAVLVSTAAPPDLTIVASAAGQRPRTRGPAIVFLQGQAEARLLPPTATSGSHALLDDLDFSGLLARETAGFAPAPGDLVLLWAGPRPLVVLGPGEGGPQLVVNFALSASTAPRVPAFPLMLHRFVEGVRDTVVGRESQNVETGQELRIALDPGKSGATLDSGEGKRASGPVLRAPLGPGFFRVSQGDEERLAAAAYFADAVEADLKTASTLDEGRDADRAAATRNSHDHPLVPFATLLAGALLATDWALLARRT